MMHKRAMTFTKSEAWLAARRKPMSEEQKCTLSKKAKERWANPEFRKRMLPHLQRTTRNRKGRKKSPQERQHQSDLTKAQWKEPSARAKLLEGLHKTYSSPQYRTNLSKRTAAAWQLPEVRERMCDGMRKRWKDPEWRSQRIAQIRSYDMPNKCESFLISWFEEHGFKFRFTGGGTNAHCIGGKYPDFTHESKSLLIEFFGDYWHEEKDEKIRSQHFGQYGYKTLVIWERELEDPNQLLVKVQNFLELATPKD